MTRVRVGFAAIGLATILSLSACAGATDAAVASLPAEGQALAAMGFDTADLSAIRAPQPSGGPTGRPGAAKDRKRPLGRVLLRRNVLHGEASVQTADGVKTVDVQRGTVTAVDDRTVTVKSTDGFSLTWTFGNPLRVVEHRTTIAPAAVKVGTAIGVAGVKSGDTTTARLIVIAAPK